MAPSRRSCRTIAGMSRSLASRLLHLSPAKLLHPLRNRWILHRARRVPGRLAPPLSAGFLARQDRLIDGLVERVAAGEVLERVVAGFDARRYGERVVEYPRTVAWLLGQPAGAELLDVGCVLNKELMAPVLAARCRALWFLNPAVEPLQVASLPVFYHPAPLADAFADGRRFPRVSCLSTLEHVGYDNSQYGAGESPRFTEPSPVPIRESFRALARLLEPGGELLVSFPYGRSEVVVHPRTAKLAWQVIDRRSLGAALPELAAAGVEAEAEVYVATGEGWRREGPEADRHRYAEGCPGARAVAFVVGRKV